eukprot:6368578-Amphidinium_carterae.1
MHAGGLPLLTLLADHLPAKVQTETVTNALRNKSWSQIDTKSERNEMRHNLTAVDSRASTYE